MKRAMAHRAGGKERSGLLRGGAFSATARNDRGGSFAGRTPLLFTALTGFWVVLSALPILFWSKGEIHLFINRFHVPAADIFFAWITNLGDGWSIVVLVLVLVLFSYRAALEMAVANILTGIASQALKRTVFSDVVRPSRFFETAAQLHTVPDVQLYAYQSFPSGHSATVFTTCTVLSFLWGSTRNQAGFWFVAVLVAFSRVYLSEHFLQDACGGSLLGFIIGFGTSEVFRRWTDGIPEGHWLRGSVLRRGPAV